MFRGKHHPDLDAQFQYVNKQVEAHQGTADPVINLDIKKLELVTEFTNASRDRRSKDLPVATRTDDFPKDSADKAMPAWVCYAAANVTWVTVGTDHDTAAFAAESVRHWWKAAQLPTSSAAADCRRSEQF
jgi:Rhodopirellula transposase DDE domain